MTDPNQLSEALLLAVKQGKTTPALEEELASFSLENLQEKLGEDNQKNAFWINIYNAFYQLLRIEDRVDKSKIYVSKSIPIAGLKLSLDDIEHGILRKYRYKYSLGYIANPFVNRTVKKLAVSSIDFRIHFALNCGAKSCPPIAYYTSDIIDEQLDASTISFLESETEIKEDSKEVHVSKLFSWFLADFGGKKGIRKLLNETLDFDSKGFKIIYKPYSWDDQLANYVKDSFKLQENLNL